MKSLKRAIYAISIIAAVTFAFQNCSGVKFNTLTQHEATPPPGSGVPNGTFPPGLGSNPNSGSNSNPGQSYPGNGSGTVTIPPSVPLTASQLADLSILVLNPTYPSSLNTSGRAKINATGSVIVNSISDTAVNLSGNAVVQASELNVTGNVVTSGGGSVIGPVATGVNPTLDPFANVPAPSASNMTSYSTGRVSGYANVTLQPGAYPSGINVSGDSTVTLNPGTYFIDNGVSVSGGSTLVGKNVLLYIDSGSVNFSGGSNVTLSPALCGPTASGLTIFQSRTNSIPASLSGNANGAISGVLYFPDAEVNFSGGAGIPQPFSLISDTLNLSGGSFLVGTGLACYSND